MTDSATRERRTVLELRNVSKRFGEVEAVKDASIEIHQGEVLTLLGPSGCGKTTTLRMAIGLERVSSGAIVYDGMVVDSGSRAAASFPRTNGTWAWCSSPTRSGPT